MSVHSGLFTGFYMIIRSQRCLVIMWRSAEVPELVSIHPDRSMTPRSRSRNSRSANKDSYFLLLSLAAHSPAVLQLSLDELGL